MPQSADSSVSVGEGMDKFQLIVQHAASYQHMDIAVFRPI